MIISLLNSWTFLWCDLWAAGSVLNTVYWWFFYVCTTLRSSEVALLRLLINHPVAVCEAELVKSFKEKAFKQIFSGFGLYLSIWTCPRQMAWKAVQKDSWLDWICQLRSPQLSPLVPGKSNQLGAHFLAYLRCFHRAQRSLSHPVPRGAVVCRRFSQLTVTRKLNTAWVHSAP